MKSYYKILLVLTFFSVSSYLHANAYIGGGGGFSHTDNPDLSNSNSSNQQYTYTGDLGYEYNINQHFASGLEGNYSNYGKTTYSSPNPASNGSFKNSAIQLLITGTYLMDNGVNTFVKAGMAHQQTSLDLSTGSESLSAWIPAIAGGIGYRILKNLNLYVQYEHSFGKDWSNANASNTPNKPASIDSLTAGINYLFPM